MGFITLVILLLFFTWIISRNDLKLNLNRKDLLIGWGLKLLWATGFMVVFTYIYSDGEPYGDVANFLNDSKVITDYASEDFGGYLEILFGIGGDDLAILQTHLADTQIWSFGDNGDFLNDNRLIIRINSVIHFISFGNYWVHLLVFAFFSQIGILLLYKTFEQFVQHKRFMYYALLCTPTIAFWGSGITKESILVLGAGMFFYGLKKINHKLTVKNAVFLIVGTVLLLINKPHFGLVIIPLSIIYLVGQRMTFKKRTPLFIGGTLALLMIGMSLAPEPVNMVDKISYKQRDLSNLGKGGIFFINDSAFCAFDYSNYDNFTYNSETDLIVANRDTEGEYKLFGQDDFHPFTIEASQRQYEVYHVFAPSESFIEVPLIDNSGSQLLKNTPLALFNVMIRPLPTDPGSNFKHFNFIENILMLVFIAFTFIKKKRTTAEEKVWVNYLLFSALILILIIGWTIPILGAIVRYKMASQLLLVLSCFIILGPHEKKKLA